MLRARIVFGMVITIVSPPGAVRMPSVSVKAWPSKSWKMIPVVESVYMLPERSPLMLKVSRPSYE